MTLASEAFLTELDAENRRALDRIAEASTRGEVPPDLTVRKLLVLALKNEIEATECAAAWIPSTREVDVKLALARQAGDEAKHYRLIQKRLAELGVDMSAHDPLGPNGERRSPLLEFLLGLEGTVARVAAGQFTREALALVRNDSFIAFCEASGDRETAALYRDVIQPDERHHHELGRQLLARLATTDDAQRAAREAATRTLALAEEIQEIARLKMGISRAPGC